MQEILPIERFRFSIQMTTLAVLPPYKGGIFRGSFGAAFRRLVCAIRRDECAACILKGNCLYVSLFAPSPPPDFPDAAKFNPAPPPYVLNPPLTNRQCFRSGSTLDFELVLMGRAIDALPYFVYTFMELGKKGIGRERGRFEVLHVDLVRDQDVVQIYDGATKTLRELPVPLHASPCEEDGCKSITVELLTPLRIRSGNHLATKLTFPLFFERLAQRVELLCVFYGNGKPRPDFQCLVQPASGIKVVESKLHWYDWPRYSARQKTLMRLGGLRGSITFEGEISRFLPLLRMGEQVNVGQGTSFGLGRIKRVLPRRHEDTKGIIDGQCKGRGGI
ncbi:MAG: CRISPR-associated protein Cas6 [Deltaproteobacteria bacterium HGW-Deltaproteobacteria-15]|nr:MAG: CRISPR-associated protein Cas6 [Deltaproteobacteria bacterium HGW-Deltaproteobacteria-15]